MNKILPPTLTTFDATVYLRVSRWTLQHWIRQGKLTSYKLGNRNYFYEEDLRKLFIEKKQQQKEERKNDTSTA